MNQLTARGASFVFGRGAVLAMLLIVAIWMILVFAPREATMGDVQRIVYLHVAVAWCGLAGCVVMGLSAAMYLVKRSPTWDHWSQSAGEVGWLCTTLTLATGSLWAHEAWNTWWTWEPRLTASLILWMIYASYFVVRGGIDDVERRARISAVLAIMALADVPMIIMATRWFRGIHPVTPEMDPRMRLVLLVSVISFTALFASLVALRWRQLELMQRLTWLERSTEMAT
jgi:heme exporter protein C